LRGILQFVHLHGPWAVHIIEGLEGEQKLARPEAWGCTGIIVDLEAYRHCPKSLLSGRLPTIVTNPSDDILRSKGPLSKLSRVVCDNPPIGICAAEYFLERKFRHFAFVGHVGNTSWSETRRITYCRRLVQDGFACEVYPRLLVAARKDFGVEQKALCTC
jgi:LacI family transcriptional regulator